MRSSPAVSLPLPKLLIATRNSGKVNEYRELLGAIPYQLTSLRQEGITVEVEETGASYEENARLKAEAYAQASGLLTLADDSGIEVDALGGAPGYWSARYGGPGLTDAERVQLLLRNVEGVPDAERSGRFVCTIALAEPDAPTRVVAAAVEGVVTYAPQGESGFGYDPIFFYPPFGKTFAQIPQLQKNAVSHRAQAARLARDLLLARSR